MIYLTISNYIELITNRLDFKDLPTLREYLKLDDESKTKLYKQELN